MKVSMDSVKRKVNEVLKAFKDELDRKFQKKMQAATQNKQ